MFGSDMLENLFVLYAYFFQAVLIVHFSLRKGTFDRYTRKYGWVD